MLGALLAQLSVFLGKMYSSRTKVAEKSGQESLPSAIAPSYGGTYTESKNPYAPRHMSQQQMEMYRLAMQRQQQNMDKYDQLRPLYAGSTLYGQPPPAIDPVVDELWKTYGEDIPAPNSISVSGMKSVTSTIRPGQVIYVNGPTFANSTLTIHDPAVRGTFTP